MKLKHIAIIGSLFPILFSLVLFFGVLISADSDDENSHFSSGITAMNSSADVMKHQPMAEKYASATGRFPSSQTSIPNEGRKFYPGSFYSAS